MSVNLPVSPTPSDKSRVDAELAERWRRFRRAYGEHRAVEGREFREEELLSLPFLPTGPLQREWSVRARTFQKFARRVLDPRARDVGPRPLNVLDLGAGNGWLCYRVQLRGHKAVALDVRTDAVDGLASASGYRTHVPQMFGRVAASFEQVPLASGSFDIVVFNAAIHYALDLDVTLREAARVTMSTGRIAILDSPFYTRTEYGEAMIAEKKEASTARFGERSDDLSALPFIEYLTRDRLALASQDLGLRWQRHRVSYPFWYEMRRVRARIARHRPPSRFDLWVSTVP